MVAEVRRQFREIKGILTKEAVPDYARCVEISTKGAQHEMLFPSLIAIIVPVIVGLVLGVAGVMGLLIGGLGSGFVLAIFMANSGGAWDNAKKYVEEGHSRRPVQGYFRPVPEYPREAHEHGVDCHGRTYCLDSLSNQNIAIFADSGDGGIV